MRERAFDRGWCPLKKARVKRAPRATRQATVFELLSTILGLQLLGHREVRRWVFEEHLPFFDGNRDLVRGLFS
jgi:hypothetical protein